MLSRTLTRGGVLVLAVALASCGKKEKALYPTEGKLLINGQPVGNVTVFFHPTDPAASSDTRSFATTEMDGSYKLTTRAINDGAPAGEYVVTILYEPVNSPLSRPKGKPPTYDKKYESVKTSPLRAKVEAKPQNTIEPFDVK